MNRGELSNLLPFKETLQHQAHSGKTGCFEVRMKDMEGRIFLTDGTITHAETSQNEGKQALFEILGWSGLNYEWEPSERPATVASMADSVQDMLVEYVFWEGRGPIVSPAEAVEAVNRSRSERKTRNLFEAKARVEMELSFVSDELAPFVFKMNSTQIQVGRSSKSDVVLLDSSVSRKHTTLMVTGDSLLIRDLGSKNGTFIDDEPVVQGIFRAGQILRIGEVECRLQVRPRKGSSNPNPADGKAK